MLEFQGIVQIYQFWQINHMTNGGIYYQWLAIAPRNRRDILVQKGKPFNGYVLGYMAKGGQEAPNLPNGMVVEVKGQITGINRPEGQMKWWSPQLFIERWRYLFHHEIQCNIAEHLRLVGASRVPLPEGQRG